MLIDLGPKISKFIKLWDADFSEAAHEGRCRAHCSRVWPFLQLVEPSSNEDSSAAASHMGLALGRQSAQSEPFVSLQSCS